MTNLLHNLAGRIRQDLVELETLIQRSTSAWERARRTGDEYYLDSVALNLHGFYSGIERIFERIAEIVDGDLPKGENWHQALLVQMTREVNGIRPAVISLAVFKRLDDLRGFRHVVRNVYSFRLEAAKLQKLVDTLEETFLEVKAELTAFAGFLQAQD